MSNCILFTRTIAFAALCVLASEAQAQVSAYSYSTGGTAVSTASGRGNTRLNATAIATNGGYARANMQAAVATAASPAATAPRSQPAASPSATVVQRPTVGAHEPTPTPPHSASVASLTAMAPRSLAATGPTLEPEQSPSPSTANTVAAKPEPSTTAGTNNRFTPHPASRRTPTTATDSPQPDDSTKNLASNDARFFLLNG